MTEFSVSEFLTSLPKGETVFYRANPGNAGDALIASGAYKLFDDADLNVELIDLDTFDANGKIVIYAGGGNLNNIYPEARDFFQRFHKQAKQLILLPHTATDNEDLFAQLGANVTLFARERTTYQHLKSHAKNANVFLDHDLALHIDINEVLSKRLITLPEAALMKSLYKFVDLKKSMLIPRPQIMLRNFIFESRTVAFKGHEVGNFFRTDVEATNLVPPEGNADLSRIYEHGTHNRELTEYTVARLMKYINNFPVVRTDRLHICIAAALLGKQVEFYANSYFKCRAVYEYSLSERFPNIKWASTPDDTK